MRQYYNAHQRAEQEIDAYYDYFLELLKKFKIVGLKKPSTPERIARFLHSLNRDRFSIALNNDNTIISRFTTLSEAFQYACNFRSVSKPANVRTVFNASNHEKQPKQSQRKENVSRKAPPKLAEDQVKTTEKKEKIWCSFLKNSSVCFSRN
jgi:hypothetical protein